MRLTLEIDYAFRIVRHLAQVEGEVVGAPIISEIEAVPVRFTLRILRKLTLAGITASKRGSQGGYYLNRPKEEITLYDIILAVDGPIVINKCLMDHGECSKNGIRGRGRCLFHQKLGAMQEEIIRMFSTCTIDEFIDGPR